jgi:hypothetical protein
MKPLINRMTVESYELGSAAAAAAAREPAPAVTRNVLRGNEK